MGDLPDLVGNEGFPVAIARAGLLHDECCSSRSCDLDAPRLLRDCLEDRKAAFPPSGSVPDNLSYELTDRLNDVGSMAPRLPSFLDLEADLGALGECWRRAAA